MEDQQTRAFFTTFTRFVTGNGASFLFWANPWLQGPALVTLPEAFGRGAAPPTPPTDCHNNPAQQFMDLGHY
jgi:hypothetical protein